MKFLVGAQLPRRLADWLHAQGFDAIHTLDMPLANATSDKDIVDLADREGRIVVTKDDDFCPFVHRFREATSPFADLHRQYSK
uniref:Mut7-C RNAse domain-containing protein n=1 Tax=Candidatus Kentrum sp. SD TaxID=2126332 RepID=A0A451BP19_9GAMM|nr:MAG: Mut7-C RNAse domain-containing protein [Candidatus Kentron sp. SD]VFK40337.1 MAG: Mut7-C RNAse domain-containing protein [Candidatus Kentron sp. SD]VFK80005.1 MAG: Mut7-C RNAse domain-containing protein [Candidatus Kentron sp. SD]